MHAGVFITCALSVFSTDFNNPFFYKVEGLFLLPVVSLNFAEVLIWQTLIFLKLPEHFCSKVLKPSISMTTLI